jgi:hypothetical protein
VVAGFWLGLWQGFIAPFVFVVSRFKSNLSVYEVHNDGAWYNFVYLPIVCSLGTSSATNPRWEQTTGREEYKQAVRGYRSIVSDFHTEATDTTVHQFISNIKANPKTVRNIYVTLQMMWKSARAWKTWSMQRWSLSIRANWSQFPAFIMATSGHVLRPYAAVCCHSLTLPSPRPATGIKREGQHNWLSRLGFCRTRREHQSGLEMCVPGIKHALACLMRCSR